MGKKELVFELTAEVQELFDLAMWQNAPQAMEIRNRLDIALLKLTELTDQGLAEAERRGYNKAVSELKEWLKKSPLTIE